MKKFSGICKAGAEVIYLSTVGVYGDRNGEVVTEATPVGPQTARSKRRVAAEEQWRAVRGSADADGTPHVSVGSTAYAWVHVDERNTATTLE